MAKKKNISSENSILDAEYIKVFWDTVYENSDQNRMEKETFWNHAWDLLNNVFENEDDKEEWQSLVSSPDVARILENIAKKLIRASKRSEKFYDILAPEFNVPTVPLTSDELKRVADVLYKAIFHYLVYKNNYYVKFEDGIKSGLLMRIIFKMGWWNKEVEEPVWDADGNVTFKTVSRGGLWLDNIDPYRYWNDGTGLNRFKLHEYKIPYGELYTLAQDPNNKYNLEEIKKLEDSYPSRNQRDSDEYKRKQQGGLKNEEEGLVCVQEFYGDIPSKDGKTIHKNMTFSIANESVVIRLPVRVGTWMMGDGFIESEIIRKPFQVYHSGEIENIASLSEFRTQLLRLMADTSLMSAMNAYEVDLSSLSDPTQLDEGFYPGMHLFVDRKDGQQQAVNILKLAQTTQDTFAAFDLAGGLQEEATQINPYTSSGGDVPSRTPARTFMAKSQEGAQFHNGISETLEDTLIVPIIQKAMQLVLQYQDWTDNEIRAVCGDDVDLIAGLSDEERFNLLKLNFNVKARGMSIELSREQEVQKIESYFKLIAEVTQMEPILAAHGYDFHEVVDDITDLFGFKNLDFIRKFKERHKQIMEQPPMMEQNQPPMMLPPNGAGAPPGMPPEMIQQLMMQSQNTQ